MLHYELQYHAKRLVCYFYGQGHSKGSYDHGSFYYIFWTVDPFVIKLGLMVHFIKPVCLIMKLDCCLSDFRLFTPGNGSRKQNIFSSNYTHSSWIIRFGYALFNVRDPIPIFDALVVLASSQYGGTKRGCRNQCFFSWKLGSLGRSLCIRGQNEKTKKTKNKKTFLPKVPPFLPWKLPAFCDVRKREFIRALHNGKPAV